jgi:hypothetical protein
VVADLVELEEEDVERLGLKKIKNKSFRKYVCLLGNAHVQGIQKPATRLTKQETQPWEISPPTYPQEIWQGQQLVIWVSNDRSTPEKMEFNTLLDAGLRPLYFPEVQHAMDFINELNTSSDVSIAAVITSLMKVEGRQEFGLPSGFALANFVLQYCFNWMPQLCFLTNHIGNTYREAPDRGFTIVDTDTSRLIDKLIRAATEENDYGTRQKKRSAFKHHSRLDGRIDGHGLYSCAAAVLRKVTKGQFENFWQREIDSCFCDKCCQSVLPNRFCKNDQVAELGCSGPRMEEQMFSRPRGWYAFGLKLEEDLQTEDQTQWHVAYHGTHANAVLSTLEHGRLVPSGTVLNDGTRLKPRNSIFGGSNLPLYLSPAIEYASHPTYAELYEFECDEEKEEEEEEEEEKEEEEGGEEGEGGGAKGRRKPKTQKKTVHAQFVFQCRVKPGSYSVQQETLGGEVGIRRHCDPGIQTRDQYCCNIDNDQLEWLEPNTDAVRPFRLLVRIWKGGEISAGEEVDLGFSPTAVDSPTTLQDSKYTVGKLMTGRPVDAAHGLPDYMGIESSRVAQILGEGVAAIRAEFTKLLTQATTAEEKEAAEKDLATVRYILDEPASEREELSNDGQSTIMRDEGHGDVRLADFKKLPQAVAAKLSETHIAALRIYSSTAFRRINAPLRQRVKPHPCAATTLFLAEGLKKLRAVHAEAEATKTHVFWRGMKNLELTEDFMLRGGTELGCMSTSTKMDIVAGYAKSQQPLVFRILSDGFMSRGADISWLSLYPTEAEILYPPLTYLKFKRTRRIKDSAGVVVDVTPEIA